MNARTRRSFLPYTLALVLCLCAAAPFRSGQAQKSESVGKTFRPDIRRALKSRQKSSDFPARAGAYAPRRGRKSPARLSRAARKDSRQRRPARPASARRDDLKRTEGKAAAAALPNITPGTPLSRVLHTSQLSLVNADGTHEQFVDADGDLQADQRTTFDADGGSFDIAVGRTGDRYEVFTGIDDRGTGTPNDDVSTGILVLARDSNGNYSRDLSATFDLGRDFGLPSAVSVVSGTSSAGREFVVVSSSGFFNSDDPDDPNNEESPGVVLLVRDPSTGGFDDSRTRELISVGDDRIFNANALALLPSGDLVIADFQSNELRVVHDVDGDRIPDVLSPDPYWDFPFSANAEDAPLDIAANSRGVVFTHTTGNDTQMLAVYDTNADGFADTDEIRAEGLSIDNNLVLHGLTVGRDGTVFIIEDAMGESDLPSDGGNGGIPRVDAFPDPALNGVLRDGAIFALADDEFTQGLSGLSFGVETVLNPVARLSMTNSASQQGDAPQGGLATINGTGLTRGLTGATRAEATARGVNVTIEGFPVPVLSFDDTRIHIQVPQELGASLGSVVVHVQGNVIAAADVVIVQANPGIFTVPQTGAGEAVALLTSGMSYTRAPFPARTGNQPSVVALLGTGWRNSLPVTVKVGGQNATVQYAGVSGGFEGLEQINVEIPNGVSGAAPVVVTTAGGATSRTDVFITVQ
ncbi:MAG TPA: IPT/TIG domain-containing protein [Pyrinomonadaceae bacterium]|nr:IPT/TIG domain-containing protein [Pyrinomonadaceae bacterium]